MASTVPITADLPVFPHLDLHLVLSGDLPLKIQVFSRTFTEAAPQPFVLTEQTQGSTFHFFAPHHSVGDRLNRLPTVNSQGVVTAQEPGVYLFQITVGGGFGVVVGRLQVHQEIEDWWFGNTSMTTAKDSKFAHAQPSLYAKFSNDSAAGTDLVGDITGHDYIELKSPSSDVVISSGGRLRGAAETTTPVIITGELKGAHKEGTRKEGTDKAHVLPVRVVDYAKSRTTLTRVRATDVANHEDQCNMVFIAEGFRAQDAQLFDRIVQRTVRDMFEKPRHQPYPLLSKSFNVFSSFEPSEQQLVTCGPRVVSAAGNGVDLTGRRIPESDPRGLPPNSYSVQELVERVGLPRRGENRSPQQLRDLWKTQSLTDFAEGRASDLVVETWKAHQSEGFLQASDTFYGLYLGRRWADGGRFHGQGEPAVQPPAGDAPNAPRLKEFIDRVYEFYRVAGHQTLELDPRRHAPEVYADSNAANPGNAVLGYLAGLRLAEPPNLPIGQNWVPDDTRFRKSRGMVAIIAYESLLGGTAFNKGTMTASTVGRQGKVEFTKASGTRPVMTRTPPPPVVAKEPLGVTDIDHLVNKVAHEFAHSFNLGDEYEDFGGDRQGDNDPFHDVIFDNLAKLSFLHQGAPPQDRKLNPGRIKWFAVPRVRISGKLLKPSQTLLPDIFEVTVGTADMGKWVQAFTDNAKVTVRNFTTGADNRQLPLSAAPADMLTNLTIASRPDEKQGTLFLQTSGPVAAIPVFKKGSVVFVQRTDPSGLPVFVVDKAVRDFVADPSPANQRSHGPLNRNRDTTKPFGKKEEETDLPINVPGFVPPKFAYQMVGIFEGGNHFAGGFYRASGECKMRGQDRGTTNDADLRGVFCFLCKWLIVNLIDPAQHAPLDAHQYPRA
ncbi:IgA Peptidase M64 [Streptomyces sp. YIM 121038]|nr:IgA Peptidase M64 [Streptomyces sp. YIM 121038]